MFVLKFLLEFQKNFERSLKLMEIFFFKKFLVMLRSNLGYLSQRDIGYMEKIRFDLLMKKREL